MSLAELEQAFQSYVLDGAREIAARVEPGPRGEPRRAGCASTTTRTGCG